MKPIHNMIRNPASFFKEPRDVLTEKNLTREDKIRILHSWEYDARELEVAEEENMGGDKPDLLRRVKKALYELEEDDNFYNDHSATKHGG